MFARDFVIIEWFLPPARPRYAGEDAAWDSTIRDCRPTAMNYSIIRTLTTVLAIIIIAGIDAADSYAQYRNDIVAVFGQTSPDGNGTYQFFGKPVLNNSGQLAFYSQLTGSSGGFLDNLAFYLHDTKITTQIVRMSIELFD